MRVSNFLLGGAFGNNVILSLCFLLIRYLLLIDIDDVKEQLRNPGEGGTKGKGRGGKGRGGRGGGRNQKGPKPKNKPEAPGDDGPEDGEEETDEEEEDSE